MHFLYNFCLEKKVEIMKLWIFGFWADCFSVIYAEVEYICRPASNWLWYKNPSFEKLRYKFFEWGDLRSNLSRFDVSESIHGSSFFLHTKFERLLSKKFFEYAILSAPELEVIQKLLHFGNIKRNNCCWFLHF